MTRLALVLLGGWCALAVPRGLRAACPEGALRHALALRLDAKGVDVVAEPLATLVPPRFALPDTTTELFDCYFAPAELAMSAGTVDLELTEIALRLEDGVIVVTAQGALGARADLNLSLCAMTDTSCAGAARATDLRVEGRFRPSVDQCVATYPLDSLTIEVAPESVTAELIDCGLTGDVFALVLDVAREQLVDYAKAELEQLLVELIPDYLATFTAQAFATELDAAGMRIVTALDSVEVTPRGLEVEFRAGVRALGPRPACVPSDAGPSTVAEPTSRLRLPSGMLAVAASAPFVQHVVQAAWLAAWLCFDTRDYELDMSSWLDEVIPGGVLAANLQALRPPMVTLGGVGAGVRLEVAQAESQVELALPDGQTKDARVRGALAVAGDFEIEPTTRRLMLVPKDAALADVIAELGDNALGLSEEGLAGFVSEVVVPLFRDSLGAIPLAPTIIADAPVALVVERVVTESTSVATVMSLVPVPRDDHEPPRTILGGSPQSPCGTDVAIATRSMDDTTPQELLRHVVTVNGEPQSLVQAGGEIRLGGLGDGWQRITVAALDLAGNLDPTPVALELDIDATPPVVAIVAAPVGIVGAGDVTIRAAATDERTPAAQLPLRYTVGVVTRGIARDELIAEGALDRGVLRLTELPDGATVRVTIFARDAAGNEAEARATFAVVHEPTMGCAAGAAGPAWVLVAALALVLRRRRAAA